MTDKACADGLKAPITPTMDYEQAVKCALVCAHICQFGVATGGGLSRLGSRRPRAVSTDRPSATVGKGERFWAGVRLLSARLE